MKNYLADVETGLAAEGSDAGFDVGGQFDGCKQTDYYQNTDSDPTGYSGSF